MNSRILVFTVFLAQLVVGEDFFWKPNNNWNNPSNWDLGRVPCGGDIASASCLRLCINFGRCECDARNF